MNCLGMDSGIVHRCLQPSESLTEPQGVACRHRECQYCTTETEQACIQECDSRPLPKEAANRTLNPTALRLKVEQIIIGNDSHVQRFILKQTQELVIALASTSLKRSGKALPMSYRENTSKYGQFCLVVHQSGVL